MCLRLLLFNCSVMYRLLLLFFVLLSVCVGCHVESFEDRCAREASFFTARQCPRRVDAYTVMDSIAYVDSLYEVDYFYTLEGVLDDVAFLEDSVRGVLYDLLLSNVVNSVELKPHKERGMGFRYVYRSRSSGEVLFCCLIGVDDYGVEGGR